MEERTEYTWPTTKTDLLKMLDTVFCHDKIILEVNIYVQTFFVKMLKHFLISGLGYSNLTVFNCSLIMDTIILTFKEVNL